MLWTFVGNFIAGGKKERLLVRGTLMGLGSACIALAPVFSGSEVATAKLALVGAALNALALVIPAGEMNEPPTGA